MEESSTYSSSALAAFVHSSVIVVKGPALGILRTRSTFFQRPRLRRPKSLTGSRTIEIHLGDELSSPRRVAKHSCRGRILQSVVVLGNA